MKLQLNKFRVRRAFTLVELMVAATISVIIMTILSTVFQIAMDAMRQVRSAADMADQLRAVGHVIEMDLGRNGGTFFMPDENNLSNSGVKLSDWNGVVAPSAGGYVIITSPPSLIEGFDGNGFASSMANPASGSHVLQFTSILPGLLEKDNYTALAGNTVTSPAAELAYFLSPSGQTLPNGNPLFNLNRRQWLVAKTNSDVTRLSGLLAFNPNLVSNTAGSINTMNGLLAPSALPVPLGDGSDILLSNVISFEVKMNFTSSFKTPFASNSDFPFDNFLGPTGNTFSSSTIFATPGGVQVRGVQIRIRIFDPKTQNARQITIVQDL